MLSASPALREPRESQTLLVVTSALRLGLVMLVWLLALVPAIVAALAVFAVGAVRHALARSPSRRP